MLNHCWVYQVIIDGSSQTLPEFRNLFVDFFKKTIHFYLILNANSSFNELKETDPTLIYPNFEEQFLLRSDAFAIGAVLSQGPLGEDLAIALASLTLCSAETKYSIIERELFAAV